MKKVFLAVLGSLALTASLSAGTITATCNTNPVVFTSGNGGPLTVTCVSFNSLGVAGATLTSGTLTFVGDMVLDSSINPPTADTATITFTPNQGFGTGTVVISNQAGQFTKTNNSPQSATSSTINAANTVIVSVSSVGTGGSLTSVNGNSNGSTFLTYTYSTLSATPEPTTVSMLGLGLLALGFGARKMRKQ